MSTPSGPRRGAAPTVLLVLGGILMLLAIIFAIGMFIWGHSGPTYGENWNDLIAGALIVYFGVPVFVIGLVLLLIGLVLRLKK